MARAERSGPSLLYTGARQRLGLPPGASARRLRVCNVAAVSPEDQLHTPLRSAFGYSNPQLTGTLDSLDT